MVWSDFVSITSLYALRTPTQTRRVTIPTAQ
jgi:hypothetical protein